MWGELLEHWSVASRLEALWHCHVPIPAQIVAVASIDITKRFPLTKVATCYKRSFPYRLDLIAFFVVSLTGAFMINERLLSRRVGCDYDRAGWLGLDGLVVGGVVIALMAEDRQYAQLRATIAGMAPTYAHELSKQGHANITLANAARRSGLSCPDRAGKGVAAHQPRITRYLYAPAARLKTDRHAG